MFSFGPKLNNNCWVFLFYCYKSDNIARYCCFGIIKVIIIAYCSGVVITTTITTTAAAATTTTTTILTRYWQTLKLSFWDQLQQQHQDQQKQKQQHKQKQKQHLQYLSYYKPYFKVKVNNNDILVLVLWRKLVLPSSGPSWAELYFRFCSTPTHPPTPTPTPPGKSSRLKLSPSSSPSWLN